MANPFPMVSDTSLDRLRYARRDFATIVQNVNDFASYTTADIVDMLNEGVSAEEIAAKTGVSLSRVQEILANLDAIQAEIENAAARQNFGPGGDITEKKDVPWLWIGAGALVLFLLLR